MEAFTCKSYMFDKAPPKIELLGDKIKKLESAQHIIEFPGGAIEVSRTTEGNYWAHIMVNRDYVVDECEGLRRAYGSIIGGRIDHNDGVGQIPNHENITQMALLIKPTIESRK